MKNKLTLWLFFVFLLYNSTAKVFAAIYTVTTTADAGVGSLRQAITDANTSVGVADVINFNIAGAGPHTITLASQLPTLTDDAGVTINGFSQAGSSANSNTLFSASGLNSVYRIIISGGNTYATGIDINSDNNTVRGLVLPNFSTQGIGISATSTGNYILGNFIGCNSAGTATGGTTQDYGILLRGDNNFIGDGTVGGANLISGNTVNGIRINGGNNNQISANYISIAKSGNSSITGQDYGIYITGTAHSNIIGGTAAGYGNVISGHEDASTNGIGIYCNSTHVNGNQIKGNIIGLHADGLTSSLTFMPNHSRGIEINSSPNNIIGGSSANERNYISCNEELGLYVTGAGSTGNVIKGNYIGPDINGDYCDDYSQWVGVEITSNYNIIGGTNSGEGNVISGNDNSPGEGLKISGNYNEVYGNIIGPGIDGTTSISFRQGWGINLSGSNNIIGGSTAAHRNIISDNDGDGLGYGVYITGTNNYVKGNYIGLNSAGTATPTGGSVQDYGIYISNANNQIGGTANGEENVISGNNSYGIYISGASATGNSIKGNIIGLRANGTTYVSTTLQTYGVVITSSANNNTIGGTNANEGNTISGNATAGILSTSTHANGNKIYGNIIGLQNNGTSYVTSHSQDYGIWLSTSHNNIIGGTSATHRNIISGNTQRGIKIDNTTSGASTGNTIKGNYIGTQSNGTAFVSSSGQFCGIEVGGTANGNIIGGTATGEANVISGQGTSSASSSCGIWIYSSSAVGNSIIGNIVGPAADGSSELTNKPVLPTKYQEVGIGLYGAVNSTVQRNVIMGNTEVGFHFYRNIYAPLQNTNGCTIKGNYIGIAADGVTFHATNSQDAGIYIDAAPSGGAYNNIIGGTNAADANIISGNDNGSGGGIGIYIASSNTTGNTIIGNIIGPRGDGSTHLTDIQQHGIYINNSPNNTIGGSSSAYRNIISGNDDNGIYIQLSSATGNVIKGNYIGIASNGSSLIASSSQDFGVRLAQFSTLNTVGGTNSGEGNVISGNTTGVGCEANSSSNYIYGNIIGPTANGLTRFTGNPQSVGINVFGTSPNNIIGGSSSGFRNIISGNESTGILVQDAATTIKGNYIGPNINGTAILTNTPTQDYGILTAVANTIGGTNSGEGNVISGNFLYGIWPLVDGCQMYQNYIGPAASGSTSLGASNQTHGIYISSTKDHIIGGSSALHRNVISDNLTYGILIEGATSTGIQIKGNYVGLAGDGTSYITSNTQDYGIYLSSTAPATTIGGTNSGEGNVISGNGNSGIANSYGIYCDNAGNSIFGNIIGARASGATAVSAANNQVRGIYINNSGDHVIGGTSAGHRNIISDNRTSGIYITGASATGISIKGNYIGTATNGTSVITSSTQDHGIYITTNANNITIGGSLAGEGNVISGNSPNGYGILSLSTNVNGSTIMGNIIGPQADGSTLLDNNQLHGIRLQGAPNYIIGGTSSTERNIISANGTYGLYITGASATGNQIKGNYIGLASDGASIIASGSQDYGIYITSSATLNTIGGTGTGEGNVISGNANSGIYSNSAAGANYIYKNIIGPTATGLAWVAANTQETGIYIISSANNIIGGTNSNHRNIISGNERFGIINSSSSSTIIKGNYIGTNLNGTAILTGTPTQDFGVFCDGTTTIGGTLSGEGNLISGNYNDEDSECVGTPGQGGGGIGGNGFIVYGNIIGPQVDGTSYLTGQAQYSGIDISCGTGTIGGTASGMRNIISGNQLAGIYANNSGGGTTIKGNYIGLSSDGTSRLSTRQTYGIYAIGGNLGGTLVIGGTGAGEGNVISGNSSAGIYSGVTISDLEIYGNFIGPRADGSTAIAGGANQTSGINLTGSGLNVIGGTTSGHRNIISANETRGLYLSGLFSQQNLIKGNYIGLASNGTSSIASSPQDYGIYITTNSIANTIGGSLSGEGNKIAYNSVDGIYITGASSSGNLISRNLIYGNPNKAINLNGTGNSNYASPTVNPNFTSATASGTASPGAIVEVFESVIASSVTTTTVCQTAQIYLGTATADGSGNWSVVFASLLSADGTPIATARDNSNGNTSEFGCPESISLPIELISFNAEKTDEKTVKTYWQTATEINNDYFTVQRSTDALEFEDIGIVDGAGNSSVVLNYQLSDNNITQYTAHSTLYYRLKQTDFDGSYSYSNIVAVDLNKNNSSISNFNIYPNPTTGDNINITLTGEANSEIKIIIRDVLGKELYAKTFITDNTITSIQLSDGFSLASGVYTVTASNKNTFVSKKVVIK